MPTNQSTMRFYRHKEINKLKDDELGFQELVPKFIRDIESTDPPYVIGLAAEWGIGKTSFLEFLKNGIKGLPEFEVIGRIELWKFSGRMDLSTAMLERIARHFGLVSSNIGKKVLKTALEVGSWASLECGIPGVAKVGIKPNLQNINKIWNGAERKLHKDFHDLIIKGLRKKRKGRKGKVVVLVDDLDRCLPDQALDFLEKLRLFFNSDKVICIIALDEAVVSDAIKVRFGKDVNIDGRWYLEKLIDRFYYLPRPSEEQCKNLVKRRLSEIKEILPRHEKTRQQMENALMMVWRDTAGDWFKTWGRKAIWNPRRILVALDHMIAYARHFGQGSQPQQFAFNLFPLFILKQVFPQIYDIARRNSRIITEIALLGGYIHSLRDQEPSRSDQIVLKYGRSIEAACQDGSAIELCRLIVDTIASAKNAQWNIERGKSTEEQISVYIKRFDRSTY